MDFNQQIQQWVTIDNQMKQLNDKIKELRDRKSDLHQQIFVHVTNEKLDNSTVLIPDGRLKFVKIKETQPLTFKYLEKCLLDIIKKEEQVSIIMNYIKENREAKFSNEIKRLSKN
jgi:hypothetical protein